MVPHRIKYDTRKSLEPPARPDAGLLRPAASARLRARLRSGSLDRALAAGADPAASRQLAARAYILTSRRFRNSVAEGLELWLQAAHGRSGRRRVLPPRSLAIANEGAVRDVATLLRAGTPLYATGIAAVGELLSDASGPAYVGDGERLARRLGEAREAMAGRVPRRDHRTSVSPAEG